MSEMKYCQGPRCHTYDTKDRKKGPKDNKRNETRRRSNLYYLGGNSCDMRCQSDWFELHGQRAVDHFGRIHEPKRTMADSAWYKSYKYNYNNGNNSYKHRTYRIAPLDDSNCV